MTDSEQLLLLKLEVYPDDWNNRLELAENMAKKGNLEIAEAVLNTAPNPLPDDETLSKLWQTLPEINDDVLTKITTDYFANNPYSTLTEHPRLLPSSHSESTPTLQLAPQLQSVTTTGPTALPVALTPVKLTPPKSCPSEFRPILTSALPSTPHPPSSPTISDNKTKVPAPIESPFDNSTQTTRAKVHQDTNTALCFSEVPLPRDEKLSAQEKQSALKDKISSLAVSILAHIAIILLLTLIIQSVPRPRPPSLIVSATPSIDEFQIDKQVIQKLKTSQIAPQAAAAPPIVTVSAISPVSMMEVDTSNLSLEGVGMGVMGMSMSFATTAGSGSVSFFGSRSKAQKVVFVVDSSASMRKKGSNGKSKHLLMKEELIKSLRALPSSVEFQIIFFSGPVWFVGDTAPDPKDPDDDWHNTQGINFWEYKDGKPSQLPVGKYIRASSINVRKVIKQIEETPVKLGTDWRTPLKMAMLMKPDVIFFMTDGVVKKHPTKEPVVKDVIAFNKKHSKAKINVICLMVPKATEMLTQLAKDSRGNFTLVHEDGKVTGGKDMGSN